MEYRLYNGRLQFIVIRESRIGSSLAWHARRLISDSFLVLRYVTFVV
jgi:hypothetical protein